MVIIVFEVRAPGGIVKDELGSPGTAREPPSLAEMQAQLTPSPDTTIGGDPQELTPTEVESPQAGRSTTRVSAEKVSLFMVCARVSVIRKTTSNGVGGVEALFGEGPKVRLLVEGRHSLQ